MEVRVRMGRGSTIKRFYFHPLNFALIEEVQQLYSTTLKHRTVGAIMATGIRWSLKTVDFWISQLSANAVLLTEGSAYAHSFDESNRPILTEIESSVVLDVNSREPDFSVSQLAERYSNMTSVEIGEPYLINSVSTQYPQGKNWAHIPVLFYRRH